MKRELIAIVVLAAVGGCASAPDRNTDTNANEAKNAKPVTESTGQQVIVVPLEPPGGDIFVKLDTNADGFLSRQEAVENDLTRNFDQYDRDRDGKISAAEYDAFAATPTEGAPPAGSGQPSDTQEWDTRKY